MRLLKIGMDAELFLQNKDGSFETAIGKFGGTKARPKKMNDMPRGFYIQEDNVAAEFNIPAASTPESFVDYTLQAVDWIAKKAQGMGYDLAFTDTAVFTEKQLDHPQAQLLGCEPDYNAWTEQVNPRPNPPADFRTASAHIHMSWDAPREEDQFLLVRMLDLLLGVPSVLEFEPTQRRTLYGKAGACRLKRYGVEYRVLGNQWIKDAYHIDWTLAAVYRAASTVEQPYYLEFLEEHDETIQHIINTHNRPEAARLCAALNLPTYGGK